MEEDRMTPNYVKNEQGPIINAVNPFLLFLILILLILGFSGPGWGVNPFMLFLIFILLILSFSPYPALPVK